MLTTEENEALTKIGPGSPMGELLRQFWTPFLPSRDLPEKDGVPKRVKLMGEDLVAFRDSNGDIGLVEENCPHRGASLFFGRNEFCGLACNYHGWKYDVTGKCVDMPNEPTASNFKDKVRITAYPVRDVNKMLWTYMGPRETPPPFPQFEVNTLPYDQVYEPHVMTEECNWVQGLEGDLDSSHVYFIHGRIAPDSPAVEGQIRGVWTNDRAPGLDVVPTRYGVVYSALRKINDQGDIHHRINQFIRRSSYFIKHTDQLLDVPSAHYYIVTARGKPGSKSSYTLFNISQICHKRLYFKGCLSYSHFLARKEARVHIIG